MRMGNTGGAPAPEEGKPGDRKNKNEGAPRASEPRLEDAFARLQAMAAARDTLSDPRGQEEEALKAAEEAKKLRALGIFDEGH